MLLLRRTCSSRRVHASLTSCLSGRKHIHPRYLGQLHTATGRNTGNTSSSNVFALALGSVALGLGGYYVGTRRAIETTPPKPVYGTPEDFAHAIDDLKTLFSKDAVTTDEDQLEAHGFSPNAYHPGCPHSIVVYPDSTEDVVKIVNVARKYRMPIIPYSGGTSLEGHFAGWKSGGICVDMSGMDKIIVIHEEDSDLVCQSGVGWTEINEALKEKGIPLFFPLDPGPTATVGGMLSTGCSGTNAVRYGTAKGEWFLNATVVLPSGEVIKTRRRSRKSSAGFDTTKLFIGAEGTLGIITEMTIRLAPVVPTTVATVRFPNTRKASEAVIEILNTGIGIQCIELVDAESMRAIMTAGNPARQYDIADHLFFKLQGATPGALSESVEVVKKTIKKHGGDHFWPAKTQEEAEAIWTDRKNILYSSLAYAGEGARAWSTDVWLPHLVYETQQDIERSGILYSIIGHAGDGNFHSLLLFKTDEELNTVRGLVHRMVERALALDGTCTGEHGVGIGKKEFLIEELGEGTVGLMKTIKRAIDPLGIMNPGKLYPDDGDDVVSHS